MGFVGDWQKHLGSLYSEWRCIYHAATRVVEKCGKRGLQGASRRRRSFENNRVKALGLLIVWLVAWSYVIVTVLCGGRTVVHPLLTGGDVIPETFPSATIYFSNIDNFMQYSEHCSAREVYHTNNATQDCNIISVKFVDWPSRLDTLKTWRKIVRNKSAEAISSRHVDLININNAMRCVFAVGFLHQRAWRLLTLQSWHEAMSNISDYDRTRTPVSGQLAEKREQRYSSSNVRV